MSQDREHAGDFLGRGGVHGHDRTLGNGAENQHGLGHVCQLRLGCVACRTGNLEPAIHAVERLADRPFRSHAMSPTVLSVRTMFAAPLDLEGVEFLGFGIAACPGRSLEAGSLGFGADQGFLPLVALARAWSPHRPLPGAAAILPSLISRAAATEASANSKARVPDLEVVRSAEPVTGRQVDRRDQLAVLQHRFLRRVVTIGDMEIIDRHHTLALGPARPPRHRAASATHMSEGWVAMHWSLVPSTACMRL